MPVFPGRGDAQRLLLQGDVYFARLADVGAAYVDQFLFLIAQDGLVQVQQTAVMGLEELAGLVKRQTAGAALAGDMVFINNAVALRRAYFFQQVQRDREPFDRCVQAAFLNRRV